LNITKIGSIYYSIGKGLITDVTSIEGPTKNNFTCNIPFDFNGINSYFCQLDDETDDFFCETDNGLDECILGIFIINKNKFKI